MIIPPKEIKAIVERTADYVTRNGQIFEHRIRQKEQNNPKFSFLVPSDPYHEYYLSRLKATSNPSANIDKFKSSPVLERNVLSNQNEAHFMTRMPHLCLNDLDVIRLVALFSSHIGRQFLTVLTQREMRNYQFEFLRPNHSFHQYFARISDQYSLLIGDKGTATSWTSSEVLNRSKLRALQHKASVAKEREEETKLNAEKVAFAQIDWHDFILVESISFDEADNSTDLPVPLELPALQNLSLESRMNLFTAEFETKFLQG